MLLGDGGSAPVFVREESRKTLDFVQTILRFLAAETVLGRGGA